MEDPGEVLLTAQRTEVPFEGVVRAVWKAGGSGRTALRLLDTVTLDNHGRPIDWFFTSKTGIVMRKSSQSTTLKQVMQQFKRIASQSPTINVALAVYATRVDVLTDEEVSAMLNNGIPGGVDALQAYVQPRNGTGKQYASFVYSLAAKPNGSEARAAFRAGVDHLAPGRTHLHVRRGPLGEELETPLPQSRRVPSRDPRANRVLAEMCDTIVRCVEAHRGERVVELTFEAVANADGDLSLVRSVKCTTVSKSALRAVTRSRRRQAIADRRQALEDTLSGATVDAMASVEPGTGAPGNLKALLGAKRTPGSAAMDMARTDGAADRSSATSLFGMQADAQATATAERKEREASANGRGSRRSPSPGSGHRAATPAAASDGVDAPARDASDDQAMAMMRAAEGILREEELERLLRNRVCPGDFCQRDINRMDPSFRDAKNRMNDSSGVRVRLEREVQQETKRATAAWQRAQKRAASPQMKRGRSRSRGRDKSRSRSPPRQALRESSGDNDGDGDETGAIQTDPSDVIHPLSFHVIARARLEKGMVDAFLEDIEGGNPSPVYGEGHGVSEGALSLARAFPGFYYRSVRVCSPCLTLYSRIQQAREAAVRAEQAPPSTRGHGRRRRHRGRQQHPQSASLPSLHMHAADSTVEPSTIARSPIATSPVSHADHVGSHTEHTAPGSFFDIADGGFGGHETAGTTHNPFALDALEAAERSIAGLSKSDIAELRQYSSPPPEVATVTAAVMLLVEGKALKWKAARRSMANGDAFLQRMMAVDKNRIGPKRLKALEVFLSKPSFQPRTIASVSRVAARFCGWVRGLAQYAAWHAGYAPERIAAMGARPADERAYDQPPVTPLSSVWAEKRQRVNTQRSVRKKSSNPRSGLPPVSVRSAVHDTQASALRPLVRSHTAHGALETAHQSPVDLSATAPARRHGGRSTTRGPGAKGAHPTATPTRVRSSSARTPLHVPTGSVLGPSLRSHVPGPLSRHGQVSPLRSPKTKRTEAVSLAELSRRGKQQEAEKARRTAAVHTPAEEERMRRAQHARRTIQAAQMERLYRGYGGHNETSGERTSSVTATQRVFDCADGLTSMPYMVLGQPDMELRAPCFVVVHDIFDTFESSQILLKEVLNDHYGCQAVVFNLPGQAMTRYTVGSTPAERRFGARASDVTLNNAFHADRVNELLQGLEARGEFVTSSRPFYLVGFGNGAIVGANFVARFGRMDQYRPSLRALVPFNGFAHVGDQLAAVLHSCVNVFSCFPPERQDLPVTYFSRFLFSDAYLQRVDPTLALNLYTAVSNPISLQGRIHLLRGALRHLDVRPMLNRILVPIVAVQSTDDALVNPASLDDFLEGRRTQHIWSHQHAAQGGLGARGRDLIEATLRAEGDTEQPSDAALVLWLRSGHEVRQEARPHVMEVLHALAGFGGLEKPDPESDAVATTKGQGVPSDGPKLRAVPVAADEHARTVPLGAWDDTPAPSRRERKALLQEHQADKPIQVEQARRGSGDRQAADDTPAPRPAVEQGEDRGFRGVEQDAAKRDLEEAMAEYKEMEAERDARVANALQRRPDREESDAADSSSPPRSPNNASIGRDAQSPERSGEEGSPASSERDDASAQGPERTSPMQSAGDDAVTPPGSPEDATTPSPQPRPRSRDVLKREPTDFDAMFADMRDAEKKREDEDKHRLKSFAANEKARRAAAQRALDEARQRERAEEERVALQNLVDGAAANRSAVQIQAQARGMLARRRVERLRDKLERGEDTDFGVVKIQALARGWLSRKRTAAHREWVERHEIETLAAVTVQRCVKGWYARKTVRRLRRKLAAECIQRAVRCQIARRRVAERRAAAEMEAMRAYAAVKIQATWRMFAVLKEVSERRIQELAAKKVQSVYRGHLARRRAARQREWMGASHGPQRLALGMKMIQESREAFDRHKQEIQALHREQEGLEQQATDEHSALRDAEQELAGLDTTLDEMATLDEDLKELTREQEDLEREVAQGRVDVVEIDDEGRAIKTGTKPLTAAERKERAGEAHQLEVALHIKKNEREKKRRELEGRFEGVFKEVEARREALRRVEDHVQEMESTRQRKEREFQRLQRNLMEMLEEQKTELDNLRAKGIELEQATAQSAAAAAATAQAVKTHEDRSAEMFQGTEELLKFQFMSMSLSYFSSLNMLKNLRGMNTDTATAAISATASSAAAAAAASGAASIPALQGVTLGRSNQITSAAHQEQAARQTRAVREEAAQEALQNPFPENVREWTVDDVARWLRSVSLGQYSGAFEEAAVDGDFLLELRPEDLRDVLGVEHELHIKKILYGRDKLRPLNERERNAQQNINFELRAAQESGALQPEDLIPPMDDVITWCRNGRRSKVEEALDQGFAVDEEDEHGNTLLILATQQLNRGMMEMLLDRGANINHQNSHGNTALHYAMVYDPDGELGEFLIGKSADDAIENQWAMSPYDGISPDE